MSTEMMLGFFIFCSFSLLSLLLMSKIKRNKDTMKMREEIKKRGKPFSIFKIPNGKYQIFFRKTNILALLELETNSYWLVDAVLILSTAEEGDILTKEEEKITILSPFYSPEEL